MSPIGVAFVLGFLAVGASARSYEELMSGDATIFYTSDNYTYRDYGIQVFERDYIIFKVKACSDAHVALMETNSGDAKLVEIVLGGWTNSLSCIRYGPQGEWLTDTYTLDLLHCGEYRTFWVHWNSHIYVGRGARYYQQQFMSTPREGDHHFDINYVSFSTGFGHTGVWEINEGIAYHTMLYTPNISPEAFQYLTRSVERKAGFFHFRAIACHDLHIAMGTENHDWNYRVNLCAWTNTKQCIWYSSHGHCENKTDVCHCSEYQPYWISWKDNVIRAGQGNRIHDSQLVEFTPSVWHQVNYLSFSTGWGAQGLWIFDDDLENSFDLKGTRFDTSTHFEHWIVTSKHHFVSFRVQACSDALICLTSEGGICGNEEYVVYIQNSNSKTGISKGVDGEVLHEVDTANALNCNMSRPFWISWYDNTVKIGYGSEGNGLIFEYTISGFEVRAMGLGTRGANTIWNIKKNHGDMIYSITPSDFTQQNLWMTVRTDLIVYFNVKGTKNAVVYLTEVPGYIGNYAYEVIIGWDTTKCIIRQKRGEDYDIISQTDTGALMNSDEFRSFWICWKDGYIKLGAGAKYGERQLLRTPEVIPHTINGAGFGSTSETLHWELEAEQGDYFAVRTDNHPTDKTWDYNWVHVYTREDGYWLYFKVSGVAACIALSTNYGDASGSYVIHFGEEDNTKISMYHWGGTQVASYTEANVMHQDEYRTFWLSWEDGNIQLGKYRYKGKQTLLSYTDSKFSEVTALGLAGLDGYVANWRFSERQGVREFSYQTNTLEDNQQVWISLMRRTDMIIGIKACKEAHMWFGGLMYSENWYDSYLIVLQNAQDQSYISAPWHSFQGMNRKIEVLVNTPGILSCDEERFFWISWQERELIIGTGTQLGKNILMSFHDFDPVPVRAFSVHTYSTIGQYRFPMHTSGFADRTSPPSNALSAGEIVGAVFGFLILTVLFVGAIYIIIRPPDQLKPYLSPPPAASGSGGRQVSSRELAEQQLREQRSTGQNFDNPLSGSGTAESGY